MSRELFDKVLGETVKTFTEDGLLDEALASLSYAGESLLHPLFPEFAEKFRKSGIKRRQLATNGLLLDTDKMRQVLIDNFAEIAVSIHSVPELPEQMQNLKDFAEQLENSGRSDVSMRANIVEDEFRTKYGLSKIIKQIEAWHVRPKVISAITEGMSRFVDDRGNRPQMCFSPYWYMAVLWNGDVLPCCHILSSAAWTLGNVAKRSLQEVFDDEPYRKLRMGFYDGTPCERCTILS